MYKRQPFDSICNNKDTLYDYNIGIKALEEWRDSGYEITGRKKPKSNIDMSIIKTGIDVIDNATVPNSASSIPIRYVKNNLIRRRIDKEDISYEELSNKTGYSKSVIEKLCCGKSQWRIVRLCRILCILGIPLTKAFKSVKGRQDYNRAIQRLENGRN